MPWKSDMTPFFSIIVPVYNVEKYIHQCLDSIIAQTYSDWECILVDDGSTDKSGMICDEYAKVDSRIKVIHKPNGGVSSARNLGLENATGEWVCFLDSDDWWSESFLSDFFLAISNEIDLVMQGYVSENEMHHEKKSYSLPQREFCSSAEVVTFLEEYPNFHNGFLWHRAFRTNILKNNNITFPEGISFAEDGCVFLQYIQFVRKSISITNVGYHYRRVEGSLTSAGSKQSDETLHFLIESYLTSLSKLNEESYNDSLKKYGWRLLIAWIIRRHLNSKRDCNTMLTYVQQLINNYQLDKIEDTTLIHRILIWVCRNNHIPFPRLIIKVLIILRSREMKLYNE